MAPADGKSVLITGASSGIGRHAALDLAERGCAVFAGVREEEDAEDLRQASDGELVPVFLDVTEPEQIASAREKIEERVGGAGLDGLVNNAGIALSGPVEHMPLDRFRKQMEVNVTGQVAVTQEFLPLVREAGGRIVFISSTSGRIATPMLGAYSASKKALEGVADALRRELMPWDMRVSVVQPGPVKTKIWDKAEEQFAEVDETLPGEAFDLYGPLIEQAHLFARYSADRALKPERVTEKIRHALTAAKPKTRYLISPSGKLQYLLADLLPDRWVDASIAKRMEWGD